MNTISSAQNSTKSKSSIEEKLKAKFGNKFDKAETINDKNKVEKEKVEISKRALSKSKENVGDISDNSPSSDLTQEKLKGLIRSGGFNFNDKEREALSNILDV